MLRQHPGEVALLTVAPLPDTGRLVARDPEIPQLLQGLVQMCGLFSNRAVGVGPREWNAFGDPHATAIVYRAPVRAHRSLGIDLTAGVYLDSAELDTRFTTPLLQPIKDFAVTCFHEWPIISFHDPLAAATSFDDRICQWARGRVEVELGGDNVAGMTHWSAEAAPLPHEVAVAVDTDAVLDHFFRIVGSSASTLAGCARIDRC